jgi:hypothetical protein
MILSGESSQGIFMPCCRCRATCTFGPALQRPMQSHWQAAARPCGCRAGERTCRCCRRQSHRRCRIRTHCAASGHESCSARTGSSARPRSHPAGAPAHGSQIRRPMMAPSRISQAALVTSSPARAGQALPGQAAPGHARKKHWRANFAPRVQGLWFQVLARPGAWHKHAYHHMAHAWVALHFNLSWAPRPFHDPTHQRVQNPSASTPKMSSSLPQGCLPP